MKKRLVIEKRGTSSTTYSDSESQSESYLVDTDFTETEEGKKLFQSLTQSDYKKPREGSAQDNMTIEEIKEKLKGYIPLRTMDEKKLLKRMPIFKTFVRYINNKTRQFRLGGVLLKVEHPDFIVLGNLQMQMSWSVQLKDNIIFIRDPRLKRLDDEEKYQKRQEQREQNKAIKDKEKLIKDKLYTMYKNGDLNGIIRKKEND
jgi:hypothetical protein